MSNHELPAHSPDQWAHELLRRNAGDRAELLVAAVTSAKESKLAAAAPDLLGALQNIVAFYDAFGRIDPTDVDIARDALVKAGVL